MVLMAHRALLALGPSGSRSCWVLVLVVLGPADPRLWWFWILVAHKALLALGPGGPVSCWLWVLVILGDADPGSNGFGSW